MAEQLVARPPARAASLTAAIFVGAATALGVGTAPWTARLAGTAPAHPLLLSGVGLGGAGPLLALTAVLLISPAAGAIVPIPVVPSRRVDGAGRGHQALAAIGLIVVAWGLNQLIAALTAWDPAAWTAAGVSYLATLAAGGTVTAVPPPLPKAAMVEPGQSAEQRARLAASEARLAEAQAIARIGSWDWNVATDELWWSDELYRIFGLDPGSVDVSYERYLDRVHPEDRARVAAAVERSLADGRPFAFDHRIVLPDGEVRTIQARGTVHRDAGAGLVRLTGTAQDISDRVAIEAALAAERDLFRALVDQLPDPVWVKDASSRFVRLNRATARHLGVADPKEAIGKTDFDFFPGSLAAAYYADEQQVVATGEPLLNKLEPQGEGEDAAWWLTSTVPLRDAAGNVIGLLGTGRDISEQRRAEAERLLRERAEAARRAAEEEAATLATLNRLGRLLAAELDRERLLQAVTDAGLALTGAAFGAFFTNTVDERGESYLLYTLSGAPKEAFAGFPMPRATAIFGPTFRGEATVRLDDVRDDPRFGQNPPYHGLPPGHLPVVSYLAVPVVARSGEVLGGLFFGHPEPGVFGERAETLAVGLAAQAAVAIANARLFEQARASEEQLRAAFEGASAGMALVGLDGRWLRVNAALCAMLGYSEAELRTMTFLDVTHPDDVDSSRDRLRQMVDGTADAFHAEKRYARQDGSVVWALLSAALVRAADGTPLHIVSQLLDVTDRKLAESERARLAAIVESAEDAIIGRDLDGTITSWNRGAERLFGYTAAEAIGQSVAILSPPEHVDDIPHFLERVRRGEAIEAHETTRVTKDGRRVDVSVTISPVRDAAGRIVGASVIARDITERKRHERLRRDFLAMVTHDLRSPLTAITTGAQLLQRRGEVRVPVLASIVEQAERMRRLLDDLADVVRLEEGQLPLRRRPVDLVALARQQADLVRGQADGHEVRVLTPAAPIVGAWDADRLGQVLQNLLGNAVAYSPPGSRVTVSVEADAAAARLAVRDQGPGIEPEHLPRLFERFYRADATGAGGLGLGLYIARMIVEAHGGAIRAESTPGAGSTFTVTLPRRSSPDDPVSV